MFHYQSAYLDQNLYCAGYPVQKHHDWKIEQWEEPYVNMNIRRSIWRYGFLFFLSVTGYGEWGARQRQCWLQSRLSESVWWRCTCSLASPGCLQSLFCAILARKAAWCGFQQSIAGCRSIAAFDSRCDRNSSPHICTSQTTARGIWIRYFVTSSAAHEQSSLAIVPRIKAWHMSDGSCCNHTHCNAIVADMLKSYKKSVAGSNNQIRLLLLPYTLP